MRASIGSLADNVGIMFHINCDGSHVQHKRTHTYTQRERKRERERERERERKRERERNS